MCHRCALWGGAHCGHSLRPLDEVYQCYVSQLNEAKTELKRKLQGLHTLVSTVERNVEAVRAAKDERVKEIRNAVELMIARLDAQLKSKILLLIGQKDGLVHEAEQLEGVVQSVEAALHHCTRYCGGFSSV